MRQIGERLLAIPHIRRLRFATKGPAVMPMKILTDDAWVDALTAVATAAARWARRWRCTRTSTTRARSPPSPSEAMNRLFQRGVHVRNQCVLIRGVNDTPRTLTTLVRRLAYVNVQPYYVYQHDMVRGVEDLRTRGARPRATWRDRCAAHRRLQHADLRRSTCRAAAASATSTASSTTTRSPASASTARRP